MNTSWGVYMIAGRGLIRGMGISGLIGFFALISITSGMAIAGDDHPCVQNGAEPAEGRTTVALEEEWRVGGEDGALLFGLIRDVIRDTGGNSYILDEQLCKVEVISPAGDHLRTLSRSGEGPGEISHPADLLFMPTGELGIVLSYPSHIVLLDAAGDPAGTVEPTGTGIGELGLREIMTADVFEDDLIVSGTDYLFSSGRRTQTRFIARWTTGGVETGRYFERELVRKAGHRDLIEREDYHPGQGLHAVGPDGRVYVASHRDQYLIDVYAPGGSKVLTIEREFTSRRRNADEQERVRAGYEGHAGAHNFKTHVELETTAPDIVQLHVRPDGTLWLQHSRSHIDQPEDAILTYDVFDPTGRFVHKVTILCPGEVYRDRLLYVGGDRYVLVGGAVDSEYTRMGGALNLDDKDSRALEVICYRVSHQ
jgi:hypothetical protein